uniref:CSON013324 protein n=1 Tax=Culicoides sonorensis TaxID=179676 RepID=A0A336KPJ5_CULSO
MSLEFHTRLQNIVTTILEILNSSQSRSVSKYIHVLHCMQEEVLRGDVLHCQKSCKFALALIYRMIGYCSRIKNDVSNTFYCLKLALHHLQYFETDKTCHILKCEAGLFLIGVTIEMKDYGETKFALNLVENLISSQKLCAENSSIVTDNEYFRLYRKFISKQVGLAFENNVELEYKVQNMYFQLKMQFESMTEIHDNKVSPATLELLRHQIESDKNNSLEWMAEACNASLNLSATNQFSQSWYLLCVMESLITLEKIRVQSNKVDDTVILDRLKSFEGQSNVVKAFHMYHLLLYCSRILPLKLKYKMDFDTLQSICSSLRPNSTLIVKINLVKPIPLASELLYEQPTVTKENMRLIYEEAMNYLNFARTLLKQNELLALNFQTLIENLNKFKLN